MHLLRKHQKRLVDKFHDNVMLSIDESLDPSTGSIDRNSLIQTKIIAPWCTESGKTGVVEHLATDLVHKGYRIMVYVANDECMQERYHTVKQNLHNSWRMKSCEDDNFFVTSDTGGIAYFVSMERGHEIIDAMRPKIHALIVEEGDYVLYGDLDKILETVPTALIIGTRMASMGGLITHLINQQTPKDGVTIDVITEDDLLAQGYDRSIHDTISNIQKQRDLLREATKQLSKKTHDTESEEIGSDESSQSTNKKKEINSEPVED